MNIRTFLFPLVAALVIVVTGLLGISASRAADGFITGTGDVPLMAGLAEQTEQALVFEVPGGRVIEVIAIGRASGPSIQQFYRETLPQLGWQPLKQDEGQETFRREGEVLMLEITADQAGGSRVRFRLNPAAD